MIKMGGKFAVLFLVDILSCVTEEAKTTSRLLTGTLGLPAPDCSGRPVKMPKGTAVLSIVMCLVSTPLKQ